MDEQSLVSELQELNNNYNDLVAKNEALNNKIAQKKSIQILVGYFGLFLLLILFALVRFLQSFLFSMHYPGSNPPE